MRWLPTLTLASLLVFIISAFLYFSEKEPKNYFQRKKRAKIQYKTFKSLEAIEEKKKEILLKESQEVWANEVDGNKRFLKYAGNKNIICQEDFNALEEEDEYMMASAKTYETFASLHNFLNKLRSQLAQTAVTINALYGKDFERVYTYGKEFEAEDIINMGNYHTGCSSGETIGLIILTVAERIKKQGWNPNEFINLVSDIASDQLRFNSYPSLIYSVGMLSNLNSVEIFTEYETYDLNTLREDIIKQSMEFRENLRAAKSEDEKLEILQNARLEREIYIQMILDFVEGLKARYPRI